VRTDVIVRGIAEVETFDLDRVPLGACEITFAFSARASSTVATGMIFSAP
jgi:hypothetical protein